MVKRVLWSLVNILLIPIAILAQDNVGELPQISAALTKGVPKISAKLIILEDADDVIIGQIMQIKRVNDTLILLDSDGNGNNQVNLFNLNGKHIVRLGVNGRGPDEYLSVSGIGVDPIKRSVIFVDGMQQKLISYSLNGEFIENINTSQLKTNTIKFGYCKDLYSYGNDILMIYPIYGLPNNPLISVIENHGELCSSVITTPWGVGDAWSAYRYSRHSFTTDGNRSYFVKPFCDTIFEYIHSDKLLKPVYTVMGKKYDYLSEANYNAFLVNTAVRVKAQINLIYLVNDLLFVNTVDGLFVYDTKRNVNVILPEAFSIHNVIASDGEYLYSVLDVSITSNIDLLTKLGVSPEIIHNAKERCDDSNPILVMYKITNNFK